MSAYLDAVRVERVWVAGGVVRIASCTRELTVACPGCGRGSVRTHSRFGRTLADVAAGGRPVVIGLSVRRLFCDGCSATARSVVGRTFVEQVEGLTVRYQRRSPLLQHLVQMAGGLLAGRGGARLLQILKVPLSRTSVLFHLMRLPLPQAATRSSTTALPHPDRPEHGLVQHPLMSSLVDRFWFDRHDGARSEVASLRLRKAATRVRFWHVTEQKRRRPPGD
ncbi:MAG: transposase family protein [Streptomyces sp.]